jgi:uncharacterized protein (DUF2249 family)
MSRIASIDLRRLPAHERHARVLANFDAMPADLTLELLSDHEPVLLQRELQAQSPNLFTWTVVESGPEAWRVHITKLARRDHCCGGCCGS